MTAARRARIAEVFRQAMNHAPGKDRDSFLDETCGGDLPLRRNVERLIDAQADNTLDSPESDLPGEGTQGLQAGDSLGHYRVEAKIGEGGMGAVYRATDTRLQRVVALKVLPTAYAMSQELKHRLLREAQAASSLNHPNIVTIYDVGSGHDIDFIAMECVAGQPLSELIGSG